MGLFDRVKVYGRCPYCSSTVTEAQTKDAENLLNDYKSLPNFEVEDFLAEKAGKPPSKNNRFLRLLPNHEPPKYPELVDKKSIRVTVCCNSVSCQFDGDRESILIQGMPSGFGRCFRCTLPVVDGVILSKFENVELDDLTEERLRSYKRNKKNSVILKRLLKDPKNKGQEVIAVRNWNSRKRRRKQ